MTPLFHPHLINEPFGDPGVHIQFLFEKRGFLFDLGDVANLSGRKLLRVSDVFVSHTHMDHFSGFDRLLRVILGRGKQLRLFGPAGFVERVEHKLAGYTWDMAATYPCDLQLTATEVLSPSQAKAAEFQLWNGFQRRNLGFVEIADGVLLEEEGFRIRTDILDHHTPCLGFALEEKCHVNIHKDALEKMGFRVGPWLRELRQAVLRNEPDHTPFRVWWRAESQQCEHHVPLGELKARLLHIVPGQKIAYIVDATFHAANEKRIVELARGSDILFIEAAFLDADADVAQRKHHLTARQAGCLARAAKVRQMVPFHFSTRYSGRAQELVTEAQAAFAETDTDMI